VSNDKFRQQAMKCLDKYDFFGYIDGSLAGMEKEEFELHIKNCNQCKKNIIQVHNVLAIIESEKEIMANPFLYTRIQEQLSGPNLSPLRVRVLKPVIIVAISMFSLVLGVTFGKYLSTVKTETNNASAFVYWNDAEHENIEMAFLNQN
jgi:hypothetical protein